MTRRRGARIALRIVAVLVAVVAVAAGLRTLARSRDYQLFGTLVAHAPVTAQRVALTFDDGPSDATLDTILHVLEARGVHATFFVTGRELGVAPEAGRRLVTAGHELGNHTYSHRRMALVSPGTVRDEVDRTDSIIRAVGHQGAIHFRPPYGYKLVMLPWHLSRKGQTTIMWDVEPDSYPSVAASADGIVRHVLSRVTPGSIILLHPWYPSRATSLAAIGPMIDSLRARLPGRAGARAAALTRHYSARARCRAVRTRHAEGCEQRVDLAATPHDDRVQRIAERQVTVTYAHRYVVHEREKRDVDLRRYGCEPQPHR